MDRGEKQILELLEKIDNYLSGDLAEEDRHAFEAAIQADPELAKNVEINRVVNDAMKDKNLSNLQEDINASMQLIREINNTVEVDFEEPERNESQRETVSIFSQKYLAIAASIAIVVVISIFAIIQYQQASTPETLVAAYLEEPYKGPPFYKGSDENAEHWAISYQNGNYHEAVNALEKIVAAEPANDEAEFYLGLCYLYQENIAPQSAIQKFKNVLNGNNRYNEQALWYLGLAYYLSGQKDLAAETLRKVTDYKQKEAATLLEKLE